MKYYQSVVQTKKAKHRWIRLSYFLSGHVFKLDRKRKIFLSKDCQLDLSNFRRKHLTPHNIQTEIYRCKGELQFAPTFAEGTQTQKSAKSLHPINPWCRQKDRLRWCFSPTKYKAIELLVTTPAREKGINKGTKSEKSIHPINLWCRQMGKLYFQELFDVSAYQSSLAYLPKRK
jgi:hypothetical protein